MQKVNVLKLQKNLFTNPRKPNVNHQSHSRKINGTDIHQIIYSNDDVIKNLSSTAHGTQFIADLIGVPRVRVQQYMKYHHIYCKPKHVYYQENMNKIIPYLKQYKRLTIVARKLNLSYPPLYKAYRDYQKSSNSKTDKPKNDTQTVFNRIKSNHNRMKYLNDKCKYYKSHYKSLAFKYNHLLNMVKKYI